MVKLLNCLYKVIRKGTAMPLSSEMIRDAIAVTRWAWGDVPEKGMVSFIDPSKVMPVMRHGVPVWGYSYVRAGFKLVGRTKTKGLLVYQILGEDMPDPKPAQGIANVMDV